MTRTDTLRTGIPELIDNDTGECVDIETACTSCGWRCIDSIPISMTRLDTCTEALERINTALHATPNHYVQVTA